MAPQGRRGGARCRGPWWRGTARGTGRPHAKPLAAIAAARHGADEAVESRPGLSARGDVGGWATHSRPAPTPQPPFPRLFSGGETGSRAASATWRPASAAATPHGAGFLRDVLAVFEGRSFLRKWLLPGSL